MFSVRIIYRSARGHPYISGMLVALLILSKGFPSLFALLISSFPVLMCTAILLGTLLSYGKPNIPEIEEEDKSQEISSQRAVSIADNVVVKRDASFTLETCLKADMGVKERAIEDALGEEVNTTSIETERDAPAKTYDGEIHKDNAVSSTSLFLQEDDSKLHGEMKGMDERVVLEKRVEYQAGLAQDFAEHHVADVGDQNESEGLTIRTAMTAFESPFDSSLGSPWEAVDTFDGSSGSDSDGAESSSPDASMADIIPMLDELHPLLDAEDHLRSLKSADNSDAASSVSSEDHESDAGITEEEVENTEDAGKESHETGAANEVTIPWTAEDQKNVMDLGYSEEERNRRLETLIARRRMRKLQRFETQKNLIDLDSLYPSSIPPISAPRLNPFDLPSDSYGNLDLPPIPGSAPSVLQPRRNPFDLPGDQEELNTLSTEYLSHHDFVSAAQRGLHSRRHENSMVGPSFPRVFHQERKQSMLNPNFDSQRMDSEETGFSVFERQLTPKSDPKVCTIPGSGSSRYTGQQDYKEELTELEKHQESIMSSHVELDGQSVEAAYSFDNKHEWSRIDEDADLSIDINTSLDINEAQQAPNAFFGVMDGELGEMEGKFSVSDNANFVSIEDKYRDSSFSSSLDDNKKISEVKNHGESDPIDCAQSANIFSDSHPSATLYSIATSDEAFLYEGTSKLIPTSLSADAQPESLGVASSPRPFEANIPLEDASMPRKTTEINQCDAESMAGKSMHSSTSSSMDSELNGDCLVTVDTSNPPEGNDLKELPLADESVTHRSLEPDVHEPLVSISDLPSNSKENFENSHLEEHKNLAQPLESFSLLISPVAEESNSCKSAADDFAAGLVPQGVEEGGVSTPSPTIPTHDGHFPGSHVLELTKSTEFSTPLEMNPENEMSSNNDSSDSQSNITDEILTKQEARIPGDLNGPHKELDDEVHPEVLGIGINEGLLSELDAVSDFWVEREPKWDRDDSEAELGQFYSVPEVSHLAIQEIPNQLQDMHEDSVMTLGVISEAKFDYSDNMHPSIDEPNFVKPQVTSSLWQSSLDSEMTVYNPKLHVLEASSIEELDSVFKKHHEEAAMHHASDSTVRSSSTSTSEKGVGELDSAIRSQELSGSDEQLGLEANPVEDIGSAFKQYTEGLTKPNISEVERTHSEPEEIASDLHVVEARSLEDKILAFDVESPPEQMAHEDGHTEPATSQGRIQATQDHLQQNI